MTKRNSSSRHTVSNYCIRVGADSQRRGLSFYFANTNERAFQASQWPPKLMQLSTVKYVHGVTDAGADIVGLQRQLLTFDAWNCAFNNDESQDPSTAAIPLALWNVAAVCASKRVEVSPSVWPRCLSNTVEFSRRYRPPWLWGILAALNLDWGVQLIQGSRGPSVADVVRWINKSYPHWRIAIVIENDREVRNLASQLRDVPNTVNLDEGCPAHAAQIAISTAFGGHSRDLDARDLVVFPRARDVLNQRASLLVQFGGRRAKFVGFHRAEERISKWESDWLAAFIGIRKIALEEIANDLRADLDAVLQDEIQARNDSIHDFLDGLRIEA